MSVRGGSVQPVCARRQAGVALALVMWFIAGMTLLVAGIVSLARTDTRLAQLHLATAKATAAGDGAINLLLADMLEGRFAAGGPVLPQAEYLLGDSAVSVLAVPVALLPDANRASPELLQELVRQAASGATGRGSGQVNAGFEGEMAAAVSPQLVADAIVQWRQSQPGPRSGAQRFKTLEEVMQVEGVTRSVWDALRDYLAVGFAGSGSSRGGERAASRTLAVLAALTPRQRASRPSLQAVPPDDARLGASGGEYRVDAMLRDGDRVWLRRRWVRAREAANGLPWRFLRTEPARIVPSATAG